MQFTAATPESTSEAEPLSVTWGVPTVVESCGLAMFTSGGVMSRFTTRLAVFVKPDVSTTIPETSWFLPSVLTRTREGQDSIGASPGMQEKLVVTGVLFQPSELGRGEAVAVIPGLGLIANLATNPASGFKEGVVW